MNKIIKVIALLVSSLFSATTFAHTGHGNNIIHSHNETNYFVIMLLVGLFVGLITYYDYKKNIHK